MTHFCLLLALLSPAFADELAIDKEAAEVLSSIAPVEAVAPPPLTLEEIWAGLAADAVLADAVDLRERGDFEGAAARLTHLAGRPDAGTLLPEVVYQHAILRELEEDYTTALDHYDTVITAHADAPRAVDAAFRRALVLEDLGRHRDALAQVKAIQRMGHWTDDDAVTLALARGISELEAGRERRGIRRIERALAQVEETERLGWIRARARTALAAWLLAEAAETELTGDRKAGKRLSARAGLVTDAEAQVVAVARLGEPEYALQGLLLLGDAYLALHDDLLAVPPPKGLSPEQVAIYGDALGQKAAVLEAKAWRYYDEGVQLAVRVGWVGSAADELRTKRDALGPSGGD